jgi:hypothetical protein
MIDPDAAKATGLKAGKVYTITNFRIYKKGSILQNVDAMLDNGEEINVEYIFKAPKVFTSPTNLGKYDLGKLKEIVREVLAEMESDDEVNTNTMLGLGETMDGRDNLTDTAGHQLDELSSQEQSIVNDIIGTLNEGMFSDMLDKVKNYAKKGLLTVAIVATLLGGTMLTTNQKQDVIDVVKTEMPASQNTDLKYQTDAWSAYTTYKYNKEKIDQLAQQDPEVADLVSTLTYRDFQKRSPNEQISIGKDYQNAINKIDSLK